MKTTTPVETIFLAAAMLVALPCGEIKAAGVFPIAATSGIEGSISMAFDGTNYLVGIQGDKDAQDNITAQLIGPTGALLGSRIKVGNPHGTGGTPSVAFDGTNYLLVWEYEGTGDPGLDIYGQRVSPSGALVGGAFAICTAPKYQQIDTVAGAVAFCDGNYLVVYSDDRSGTKSVYGQLVSTSGELSGPEITFSTGSREASVATDGTDFLVVWQKRASGSKERYDTVGRFISPSGSKRSPFVISQTRSARFNPLALVFNGKNYLVVWNKDIGPGYPAPSDFDIYGRFVSPGGSFPGDELELVTGNGDQILPGVAFDGSNYLLSWTKGAFGSSTTVKFQFFNRAAHAEGSQFSPFTVQGSNDPTFANLLFDGNRFASVCTLADMDKNFNFKSGDVYGTFIPKNSAPKVPDIAVEQPLGSSLADGAANKAFGSVGVGSSGTAKTFTIRNTGSAKLTGLAITKNGANAADFKVTAPAAGSLAPGDKTTFKVTFKPIAKGTRRAAIHIKSNDANENPFDIKLSGMGVAQ